MAYTTATVSNSAQTLGSAFARHKPQQHLECEDAVRTSSRLKPGPKRRASLPATFTPETNSFPASYKFLDIHVAAGSIPKTVLHRYIPWLLKDAMLGWLEKTRESSRMIVQSHQEK